MPGHALQKEPGGKLGISPFSSAIVVDSCQCAYAEVAYILIWFSLISISESSAWNGAPGLTVSGWTIMAYITGKDSLFPNGQLQVTSQTVCYGYLARQASGEMVAVIRGANGFVEWVEDAMFAPIPYAPQIALPAGAGALEVEQGFWTL
jgi:hypothetical protein